MRVIYHQQVCHVFVHYFESFEDCLTHQVLTAVLQITLRWIITYLTIEPLSEDQRTRVDHLYDLVRILFLACCEQMYIGKLRQLAQKLVQVGSLIHVDLIPTGYLHEVLDNE